MFLGPGCSKATMPVAEAIHYWNIVQVSSLMKFLMKLGKGEDHGIGDYDSSLPEQYGMLWNWFSLK